MVLGFNRFETSKEKQERLDAYNLSIFPYGDKQKEKILEILKYFYPKTKNQELTYNYIITKEEVDDINVFELEQKELKKMIKYLKRCYMGKVDNICNFIVLAYIDINIDENSNYPNVEELKIKINQLESKIQ